MYANISLFTITIRLATENEASIGMFSGRAQLLNNMQDISVFSYPNVYNFL